MKPESILNERDYNSILNELRKQPNKAAQEDFLTACEKEYMPANSTFYLGLFEALSRAEYNPIDRLDSYLKIHPEIEDLEEIERQKEFDRLKRIFLGDLIALRNLITLRARRLQIQHILDKYKDEAASKQEKNKPSLRAYAFFLSYWNPSFVSSKKKVIEWAEEQGLNGTSFYNNAWTSEKDRTHPSNIEDLRMAILMLKQAKLDTENAEKDLLIAQKTLFPKK